ncbi:MAG TPA: hypothetical protein VMW75_22180 [Thermoanaerobaculia bacterium]|nr:hypothetical protein [Thermoanaerobaculia bacterium]
MTGDAAGPSGEGRSNATGARPRWPAGGAASGRIALVLAVWLAAAGLAGAAGLWLRLPAPLVGATLWLLVAGVLIAWRRSPALGGWLRDVDPRVLILLHVTRFVGIEFLALFQRGMLPFAFATPGGYGDILAALGALLAAAICVPVRSAWRRLALLGWNSYGLLELLLVVGTAMHFFLTRPADVAPLRQLPLCLLPTFLVPILIVSHLVLFARFGPAPAISFPQDR